MTKKMSIDKAVKEWMDEESSVAFSVEETMDMLEFDRYEEDEMAAWMELMLERDRECDESYAWYENPSNYYEINYGF